MFVLWYLRICYLRICYKPTPQHADRIHWRRVMMPNQVRCWSWSCSANLIVGCWSCTTQWKDNSINTWFVREFDSRLLHKREHRHPDLILGECWFTTQRDVDVGPKASETRIRRRRGSKENLIPDCIGQKITSSERSLFIHNQVTCWCCTTQWNKNSDNADLAQPTGKRTRTLIGNVDWQPSYMLMLHNPVKCWCCTTQWKENSSNTLRTREDV